MKALKVSIFVALLISFSGCSLTYSVLLGVKSKAKWQDEKSLKKRAKQLGIPGERLYLVDTVTLRRAIIKPYKEQIDLLKSQGEISPADSLLIKQWKHEMKDQLQPVQILYFDQSGKQIFWMINCYVDPVFPKMNWNIEGAFDQFPPKKFSPLNDTFYHTMDFYLAHLHDISGKTLHMDQVPKSNYYALVLWNDIFKRPSRKLIETLQAYHKKHQEMGIHTLYASNQNEYLWSLMDQEQKDEVMKSQKD